MKTKEIIATLKIQNGVKGNKKQREFFAFLINELRELYNQFGQKDSDRHFDAAVKMLRAKWDGISNKIQYGLTDGYWNYFYATEIINLKGELCPSWAERKRIEHEQYEIRKAERIAREEARARSYDTYDL